jgi:predicted RecB family nuclease
MNKPTTISKSRFVAGVQCLKRLYLQAHQPELAAARDEADEAILQQGREVGLLARQMFPGGVEVSGEGGLVDAIRRTQELIKNPDVPAIFEAAFEHDNVVVRIDILQRRRDGRWRLIEVKSTADLKDHHLEDIAIQYRVLSRCGLDVASACLAHINRNYVFGGGNIDVRRLLKIRNLTRRVERLQPKLIFQLRSAFRVLAMPAAPDLPTGPHCTNPVHCEFYDHCNPSRPNDHIRFLPRLHASAAEELEELGVESIHEIPADFELTEIQRRAAVSVQTGEPWFDRDGLATELASLKHPLYFVDFESVNPAVPRFAGMRPFDQIVFQWSLHTLTDPGAEPKHYEFLATDANDPRRDFIASLSEALGHEGSIVVYSQFEATRLAELAVWLTEFAGGIRRIQHRLFDLLPAVRNYVYHPEFAGSYSLKAVLPALVPDMTYEGMEVANGQEAGLAWESLVRGNLDQAERERIRNALLDYCGQDTLALLRLLQCLLQKSSSK